MDEDDLISKYQEKINETVEINNQIYKDFTNFNNEYEKFIENLAKVEGELPYLNQDQLNQRLIELYMIVRDSYKHLINVYSVSYANMQNINRINLELDILKGEIDDYKKLPDITNKLEKLEENTSILNDKGIRWVLQDLSDRLSKLSKHEDEED